MTTQPLTLNQYIRGRLTDAALSGGPVSPVAYPTLATHATGWGMTVEELSGSVPFRGFSERLDPGEELETGLAETIAAWLDRETQIIVEVSDLPAVPGQVSGTCCTTCAGHGGVSGEPCADCYATGHLHESDVKCEVTE